MARSKCAGCGVAFSSVSAFDAHRIGDYERRGKGGRLLRRASRRCLSLVEMAARGMERNTRGLWTTGRALPAGAFGRASA